MTNLVDTAGASTVETGHSTLGEGFEAVWRTSLPARPEFVLIKVERFC